MTKFILTTTALLLVGITASAAPAAKKVVPARHSAESAVLVCPVTGDKIASIKDAVGSSTYKGKTYYFCCSSCKPEFDKDPAKYAKKAASVATAASPAATHKM